MMAADRGGFGLLLGVRKVGLVKLMAARKDSRLSTRILPFSFSMIDPKKSVFLRISMRHSTTRPSSDGQMTVCPSEDIVARSWLSSLTIPTNLTRTSRSFNRYSLTRESLWLPAVGGLRRVRCRRTQRRISFSPRRPAFRGET